MAKTVGKNVSYEVDSKNKLTIIVDLNKDQGQSKSGKTVIIASTSTAPGLCSDRR